MSGSESRGEENKSGNSRKGVSRSIGSFSSDSGTDDEDHEEEASYQEKKPQHLQRLKVHEDVENELSNFRKLWKKDISENLKNENSTELRSADVGAFRGEKGVSREEDEVETRAKKWFLQGVDHEKNGQLIEAIRFYKKAVQLVPDIELKLCDAIGNRQRVEVQDDDDDGDDDDDDAEPDGTGHLDGLLGHESEFEEDDDENLELLVKLQKSMAKAKGVCKPARPQTATHISALPLEIILYILRWVVSHDLDLRSLEMCSMVSRGFYVCSRDPEIWRMACLKVWGMNCGNLKSYDSWRTMYLKRPHLNYNGCYISKTTYIRHGETSFQDQFYRPWHVVEYYRYFRFFPEGVVFMLTTPDQPPPVTCLLKGRENRHPSLLTGHYRLQDDSVYIVLQREDLINNRFRKRKTNLPVDLIEQTFHIELQVVNRKNRINNCLVWKRYCVTSLRGQTETKTSFEVMSNKFPCLWFSRVKSYTSESERPLL